MNGAVPERTPQPWVSNEPVRRGIPALNLSELWTHRELAYFFALRDLKVRYKQAFLGTAWAVLQPLAAAAVFYALFHRLARIELATGSYFAFAVLGAGAWSYFSGAVQAGANSLLRSVDLLTKVAFPRVVAPTAAVLPGLADLAPAAALALAVAAVGGDAPSPLGVLVGAPLGVGLLVLAAAGPAWLLSAVLVQYRDVGTLTTFALQFLQFACPVVYPPEFLPEPWRTLVYLNPVSGALALLRWALVGTAAPPATSVLLSCGAAMTIAVLGLVHFRRRERELADVI